MPMLRTWWLTLGLGSRWLAVSVALVLGMQGLVLWVVQGVMAQQAQQRLHDELRIADRMMESLLARETARLHEGAMLLAANHGFRTALDRGDVRAMQEALDHEGQRIGAPITAVFGPDLQLRATNPLDALFLVWLKETAYPGMQRSLDGLPGALPSAHDLQAVGLPAQLQQIAALATRERTLTTLALLGAAPFQFVVVPVVDVATQPVRAWVLMGFPLQRSLAKELQETLDVQVVVLAAQTAGPTHVVFDTLGQGLAWPEISGVSTQVQVNGDRLVLHQRQQVAVGGEVRTVLLRSHSAVMQPFYHLQLWLGAISLVGLGLFLWVSARSLHRMTEPLRTLQRAAQALQQGRFDISWPVPRGNDEVARLSRGFEAMRQSLSAQQAEIRRLAYRDRLTGLPNRQRFVEAVELALGQAQGQAPVAVLTLNLDRFKHVNEVLGYAFGDELLRAVAQRLGALVEGEQLLARLGGDEFGVLLPGQSADGAAALARHMLEQLAQGVVLAGQPLDVRASVGIAQGPDDAHDADMLVNRAEMAMRWAKRRLTGVQRFLPEHDSHSGDTLSLLGDLREAVTQGQLKLYLQPKLALNGTGTLAAEALLRWQHPKHGLVSPARFIPFAEQTGFVCELTRWTLDAAAQAAAQWRRAGMRPCCIAVNVSARDLLDEHFPEQVQAILLRHGVSAADIALEITESAIMDDPERAQATLWALADLGVGLAIDDFGTGYSSLAYLKRLPVQTLKIDQTFVRDLGQQNQDALIVRSTIELAHALGLDVVAEGVEDATTLEQLRAWGCDWAQGYHLARPMPRENFAAWVAALHPPSASCVL